MFRKVLIAAAFLIASPALVSAQDIFWSFSQTEVNISISEFSNQQFSAYIFSDGLFSYDSADLDFTTSDSSVIQFTGGEAFNPSFPELGDVGRNVARFGGVELTIDSATNTGRLFLAIAGGIPPFGINRPVPSFFDPGFNPSVGPNGALLLARVDFNIVGGVTADLELALGTLGVSSPEFTPLDPSFGSATLDIIGVVDRVGDINMDFATDFADIPAFIAILASGVFDPVADLNFDGEVNFADIPPFIFILQNI